ncbi:MAG: HlyD family efflux transporter periplasmic adaptor subunit [Bacteroidota bacterium]
MKRIYSIALGIGILVMGLFLFFLLGNKEDASEKTTMENRKRPHISVAHVNLQSRSYVVTATGTLAAKEKIELYSEVQGVLLLTGTPFKEGNRFAKGQTILRVDNSEYLAQLQSSKSNLVSEIAAMLADMEIEFPEAAKKWEQYLRDFDVNERLQPLPGFSSDAEKFFVTGRNITKTYFDTKNQQERLAKYNINAPFSGTVTEANVNPGTLVRSGQKLGEFIDTSVYELRLSIPATENQYLDLGKQVSLRPLESTVTFQGEISRINPKINQQTQTIEVFVEVSDARLKDGQYLTAQVFGEDVPDVLKIANSLILENDHVYIIKDSTLQLQKVVPFNYVGDSVVVKGLKDGMLIVDEIIANAYPGLKVTY